MHYAGARYYISALGPWNGTNLMADDFPAWSPYNYGMNSHHNLYYLDGRAPGCPPTVLRERQSGVGSTVLGAGARPHERAGPAVDRTRTAQRPRQCLDQL